MVQYRRAFSPGGTYFFTVTLKNRNSTLLTDKIAILDDSFRKMRDKFPFKTHGIVVLPEHLHTVWELPKEDADFSTRWRLIKHYFTRNLLALGIRIPKNNRGQYFLWQNRFWEHLISDSIDFEKHIDYIHYNPVKHNLVKNPIDWPYSSIHQYIK